MGQKTTIEKDVLETVKRFKRESGIEKVLVFGSAVRGARTRHSDVDLVLVDKRFEGKKFFERPVGLHRYWHSEIPVDFLCYTPEEFERLQKGVTLVGVAVKEGVAITA